jgi:hypothetical protein
MRRASWGVVVVLATCAVACTAVLGIHDPEVEGAFTTPHADGSAGDDGSVSPVALDGSMAQGGDGSTVLTCPKDHADCNKNPADGCETDTSQPQNCGGCGHVCLACANAQCVPAVVASGGTTDYAGFVAVDAKNLYWASVGDHTLFSVTKTGGSPVGVHTVDPLDSTSLFVGTTYLGVSTVTPGPGVRLVARSNGAFLPYTQSDACGTAHGLVMDETDAMYYAHRSDGSGCGTSNLTITKRTPNGSGVFAETWAFATEPLFNLNEAEALALDSQYLYYVGFRASAPGLYKISRAGGNSTLVLAGHFNGSPIAVDDKFVYTVRNNDLGVVGAADLIAIDKASGGVTQLATGEDSIALSNGAFRASLVIDATYVYWTASDGKDDAGTTRYGRIMRVKKAGGAKETIASRQPWAYGVAVDDSFIYWTSSAAIKRGSCFASGRAAGVGFFAELQGPSASANARIDGQRSAGSSSSARMITASRPFGKPGSRTDGGMGPASMAITTDAKVSSA